MPPSPGRRTLSHLQPASSSSSFRQCHPAARSSLLLSSRPWRVARARHFFEVLRIFRFVIQFLLFRDKVRFRIVRATLLVDDNDDFFDFSLVLVRVKFKRLFCDFCCFLFGSSDRCTRYEKKKMLW